MSVRMAQGESPLAERLRPIPEGLSGSNVPAQSELVDRSRKFKFSSEVANVTKSHPRIKSVPRESEPARIAHPSWSDYGEEPILAETWWLWFQSRLLLPKKTVKALVGPWPLPWVMLVLEHWHSKEVKL